MSDVLLDCPECGGRCKCPRCHGMRYVWVPEGYVHGDLTLSPRAVANTVYPCRDCNARQYARWAAGCLEPGHDVFSCSRCQADGVPVGTARRRRGKAPLQPPPPDDEHYRPEYPDRTRSSARQDD